MAARQQRPSTYTVGFTGEDLSYEIVDDDLRFARLGGGGPRQLTTTI